MYHSVTPYTLQDIDNLKILINAQRQDIPTSEMCLWKINNPLSISYRTIKERKTLIERIQNIHLPDMNSPDAYEEDEDLQLLVGVELVSSYWKVNPSMGLHIVVQHLPSDCARKRRRVDNDDILASLNELWNHAWGRDDATLFETRQVVRDGTSPQVATPNEYRTLNIPGNALKKFGISTILVRNEYAIALKFAIFVARGGSPLDYFADDDPHLNSQDEWDLIIQSNPFRSPDGKAHVPARVSYLGHPGIGKTLFLFIVLALRVMHSLPSIYMVKPDCMYVIDSRGARKVLAEEFDQKSVTADYWGLVDSNCELTTMPDDLLTLRCFVMQTGSPRDARFDWWMRSPFIYTPFFMKQWSLPELIIGRTLQVSPLVSEQQIETFLSQFIPSAREVFNYAAHPTLYDTFITRVLRSLTQEDIQNIVRNAKMLKFGEASHHLVLISPKANRIDHRVEIPTRYIYDKLRKLATFHALDTAFLYETFKVKEAKGLAGYIYEDLIH